MAPSAIEWIERHCANLQIQVVSTLCQKGSDCRWGLRDAVARAEKNQIDADLGGGVIKQRIARPGQGKSKGYRTIILFRRGAKAFFVYGFAKSQRANINDDEEEQFKEAAKHVLALTEKQLAELLKRGDFFEVKSE
jgi:hypothetical protein